MYCIPYFWHVPLRMNLTNPFPLLMSRSSYHLTKVLFDRWFHWYFRMVLGYSFFKKVTEFFLILPQKIFVLFTLILHTRRKTKEWNRRKKRCLSLISRVLVTTEKWESYKVFSVIALGARKEFERYRLYNHPYNDPKETLMSNLNLDAPSIRY